ncbi:solute carrier family 2, facilitated glucose transporter member 11-like isoform X2 [Ambystoma mexicanum]|uniref:solute carrier family 2, facilitated glucose transporter member 11-like isoform X2 n=1 Tax=Ambystoma mexicanum TaxID=8296 RepID=UPI0037E7B382
MASLLLELLQCRLMVFFICVTCIGPPFQFGFHISVVSAPAEYIKDFINQTWIHRYGVPTPDETLTLLWSLTVSIFSIGGLLGSLASGFLIRRYGKSRCMLCNNLVTLGASMIIGFSKMAGSFEMILVGRFLFGITSAAGINVSMLYLGEIAPKKLRGLTNTAGPVFATSGKLFGLLFGLREALGRESLWPFLMSICGVTSALQLATFPFVPDTPPHLLLVKNDKEGCMKAMKKLWGDGNHQAEIEDLINEQNSRKNTKIQSFLEIMQDRSLRLQLCVLTVLIITLQFGGANAIYFYAYDVFQQAGFSQDRIPYIAIGIGGCEILGALLCDAYYWVPYCSVVLIFCHILSSGLGPGGVTLSLSLEILTQAARPSAFTFTSTLSWAGLYIIGLIFPFMVKSMGHFCFLLFLGIIVASSIFLFLILPETKGKSITEITDEFNRIQCGKICCHGTAEGTPPDHVTCTRF